MCPVSFVTCRRGNVMTFFSIWCGLWIVLTYLRQLWQMRHNTNHMYLLCIILVRARESLDSLQFLTTISVEHFLQLQKSLLVTSTHLDLENRQSFILSQKLAAKNRDQTWTFHSHHDSYLPQCKRGAPLVVVQLITSVRVSTGNGYLKAIKETEVR